MAVVLHSTPPTAHFEVDKGLALPIQAAKQLIQIALDPRSTTAEQTGASIAARFLCVTQAIACLVVLPFKMIFATFQGLYTLYSENYAENALSAGYALLSVGAHASAIPAMLVLAFLPSKIIENGADLARQGLELTHNLRNRRLGEIPNMLG